LELKANTYEEKSQMFINISEMLKEHEDAILRKNNSQKELERKAIFQELKIEKHSASITNQNI
jgi:hypothetical protein